MSRFSQPASTAATGCTDLFRFSHSVTLVVLFLCLSAVRASAEGEKIVISASQTAILVWVAQEGGLFEAQNLDVEVRLLQSGIAAADMLIDDKAQLSTTADGAFVTRAFDHPDLGILATISASGTTRLIGRKDRGIVRAEHLTGKRIGVTLGSIGEYFLTRYLSLHGVEQVASSLVDLKPSEIAEGLVRGTIDAGLTWEPFISEAERHLKDNAVMLPEQMDQIYYFLLLAKRPWIEKHPETVEKLLTALIQAEEYCIDKPSKAKALLQNKFGYSTQAIDALWRLHSLHISLPQNLLFHLELQAEWQIKKGLTSAERAPDFLSRIVSGPLDELRPSSVGIVK